MDKETKEIILSKSLSNNSFYYVAPMLRELIYNAMQEYSNQQTQLLTEQMQSLKDLNNELQDKLKSNQEAYEELHDNYARNYNQQLELTNHYKSEASKLFEQLSEKEKRRLEDENDFIKALNQADEQRVLLETKLAEKEKELSEVKESIKQAMQIVDLWCPNLTKEQIKECHIGEFAALALMRQRFEILLNNEKLTTNPNK